LIVGIFSVYNGRATRKLIVEEEKRTQEILAGINDVLSKVRETSDRSIEMLNKVRETSDRSIEMLNRNTEILDRIAAKVF
jgi:methyl-accepting chemotaxis protein